MGRRQGRAGGQWPLLLTATVLAAALPAAPDTLDGAETATGNATTLLEIMVGESEIRAVLETGVPDLIAFEGVLPDDFRVRMGLEPEPEDERLRRFFAEDLVLRVDGGEPLAGRRLAFTTSWRWPRDPLTGERGPVADGGGMPVAVVGLAWQLDAPPDRLRIEPAMVGRADRGATVALAAHHLGIPVAEPAVLGGPATLALDRKRPWRSRLAGAGPDRGPSELLRVVLAVGTEEVRVEVIAPQTDLARWLDLEGDEGRRPAASDGFTRRVAGWVVRQLELRVDGEPADPIVERVEVAHRRLAEAVEAEPAGHERRGSFVRAVLSRAAPERPTSAELRWRLFPGELERVVGIVVDGNGATVDALTSESSTLTWAAPAGRAAPRRVEPPPPALLRPAAWLLMAGALVAGLVLVGSVARAAGGAVSWGRAAAVSALVAALIAGSWAAARAVDLDDRRAAAVVEPTLHNLYLAGNVDDADRRAAVVGRWVADGLEAGVAEGVRRPFERAARGRDLAVALGVDLEDIEARRSGAGFVARCRWRVEIGVIHWGHLHRRVDDRAAELTFEPADGVWTLTGWSRLEAGAR